MFLSMKHFTLLATLSALAAIPLTRGATIEVTVGGAAGLKFQPDFVNANVGDVVRFIFQQKNHTVTQSTLAAPCAPMAGGFDSGFVPIAEGQSNFPVAELEIHDTAPQWVYCKQGNHCAQGMVFAVNPADKMEQFRAAATGQPQNPTQPPPSSAPAPPASSPAPPAPSSSAPGTTGTEHKVVVGGGQLLFNPSNIQAAPGDTVTFEFRQKSHSVTQSTFSLPCQPMSVTNVGTQSFDSGLQPVPEGQQDNFPTWSVTVNGTDPIWAYCKAATHCMQGMVFSINANQEKTFEAFRNNALGSSTNTISSNNTTPGPVGGSSTANSALALSSSSSCDAGIMLTAMTGLMLGSLFL